MEQIINIYCDESCHLENMTEKMTLGLVWCPMEKTKEISKRIREIKTKHSVGSGFEIKWNKVSSAKKQLYYDVIDYFFDHPDFHFRAIVADKNGLNHNVFRQNHELWYYKMMFLLIKNVLNGDNKFNIYLDIKDTQSPMRTKKLHEVLCNSMHDFEHTSITRVQNINSRESEQMQVADLLMGAVGYANRGLDTSRSKLELVNRIRERSRRTLTQATWPSETKFNIFLWHPRTMEDSNDL